MIQNEYKKTELIKRILIEIVKPYWIKILFAIILMILVAATNSWQAFLIQPALDQTLFSNLGEQSNSSKEMLFNILSLIVIVSVAKAIATYYQQVMTAVIATNMINDVRLKMFEKFINMDMKSFSTRSSGAMLSSITNDINGMMGGITEILTGVFKNIFSVVFLFGVMLYMNPTLTAVSLIGVPLAIGPIVIVFRRLRKQVRNNQNNLQSFNVLLDDTLKGIKVVKSYNAEKFEISRMSDTLNRIFRSAWKIARVSNIPSPLNECLVSVGMAAVLYYGGNLVIGGDSTPGSFFAFFAAMMMAYKPMKAISGLNIRLQLSLICAERVFTVLDTKNEVVESKNALKLENVQGNIDFENVAFSYNNDSKNALKNINLHIEAGKKYAFVGHSGGGKSTIMSLLLRFYDASSGVIKIDGVDIRDVSFESLRNNISYVGQEIQLFDDTILQNIRYGKKDASEEEIITAAKLAQAHDFIIKTENGYETHIGQNGHKLSGGQRQRISIARAILKNSPILLLDEATSALDPVSEKLIQDGFDELMKGKTSLIIAHRLSTVINADVIFVVSDGEIVEGGNHEELLAKNGEYSNLYNKQLKSN